MSTKSVIQTLINTKLATGSIITASEHREVEDILLGELFPITTNYTLSSGDFQYNLNFTKSGNFCHVEGFVKNGSAQAINGVSMFTVPDSIYYPKKTIYLLGFLEGSATGKRLYFGQTSDLFAPNQIKLLNGIGEGDLVRINATYITND